MEGVKWSQVHEVNLKMFKVFNIYIIYAAYRCVPKDLNKHSFCFVGKLIWALLIDINIGKNHGHGGHGGPPIFSGS